MAMFAECHGNSASKQAVSIGGGDGNDNGRSLRVRVESAFARINGSG